MSLNFQVLTTDIPINKVAMTFVIKDVTINTQFVRIAPSIVWVEKLAIPYPRIISEEKNSRSKIRSLTDCKKKGEHGYNHDGLPFSPHSVASEKLIALQPLNISRKVVNG